MAGRPRNTADALWRKVELLGPSDCWRWLGGTRNGYGHFTINRKGYYAHRVAAGVLDDGSERAVQIMHLCNNKLCCNPRHLKLGTPSENTQAAYRDGLARSGVRHHRTKLPFAIVQQIKGDHRPQLVLAAEYGISQSHVSRIKRGETRKHEIAQ
jgi:hypothetical protein